jgi:hypothetical protein
MTPFLRCSIASLLFPMASMPGVFAQDEARGFKPMWKVGDSRTTTTTRQAQEVKYGLVEEDTTYMTSSTIEVAGMDPNAYALEVRYTNVALQAVAAFYDGLGEELKAYQDLVLAYHADKKTGAAELQNWKEAQAFMDRSFIAISRVMEKQGPEASRTAERAFAPLKSVFASKESIEAYMESQVGFLFFPFGKTFTPGDTLRMEEWAENPFNPEDSVARTTLAWLVDADGPGGLCEVHSTVLLDLTAYKEGVKSTMRKAGGSVKEIDGIDFDATNSMVITFDEITTWPTKVVQKGNVVASDAKGRKEKSVVTTTVLNQP